MANVLSDEQVLDTFRRLYRVDPPYWVDTLSLVVEVLEGDAGLVAVEDDGFRVMAQVGAAPGFAGGMLLEDTGARVDGDTVVVRSSHKEISGDTLWVVTGCPEGPEMATRAGALAGNLEMAIDFAQLRTQSRSPMSGRLAEPDGERLAAVVEILEGMPERAACCVLLAARGHTNGQISDYLGLAPSTTARSLQEAYRHFGLGGRHALDIAALLTQPKPPPG